MNVFVLETEGAQRGVTRDKRGIVGGNLVTAAVCTLVDDILQWKSCKKGQYVFSRT